MAISGDTVSLSTALLPRRQLARDLLAAFALHHRPNPPPSFLRLQHPFPNHPRRVVPHVNRMAAVQLRSPVALFVLIKIDNSPLRFYLPLSFYGKLDSPSELPGFI